GIRHRNVTGVQTCALPISSRTGAPRPGPPHPSAPDGHRWRRPPVRANGPGGSCPLRRRQRTGGEDDLIGRQSADATVEVDLESGDRRALDEESTGVGGGEDREILVAEAGLEVGPPGVQSLPVADIELDPADSLDA